MPQCCSLLLLGAVADAAARFVEVQEMVMSGDANFRSAGKVELMQRAIGGNTIGVVAWLMLLRTPECPDGRQVVVTPGTACR